MKLELPSFKNARVLVVGDIMLDRYWYGDAERISPEAPVPVVHVKNIEERPGGAGNVALNIAALGSQVSLFGLCGDDAAGQSLQDKLEEANIICRFNKIKQKTTITKLRILSLHQQLIRLDFEDHFNAADLQNWDALKSQEFLNNDALIISDYGKGSLGDHQHLIQRAVSASVPVLVDPKGKDFSIYRGATLITPNRKEFEAVVGSCHTESEFVDKGIHLLDQLNIDALLVTRGAQGMILIQKNGEILQLPAIAREVYDVTGAGDTVIAVLGACIASGCDLPTATVFANNAAGIVVGKLGAATVTPQELFNVMTIETPVPKGVLSEDQLMIAVNSARARGERIVMTNGCFDILHAGHVSYLQNARDLGDRLIIAVNTDSSVAGLKGPSRPINALADRMAVLAALSSVDWVVPFSEATPERLISKVLPDILVKGGDYQASDVAGGLQVIENGGEVRILNFLDGFSTSKVIKHIQQKVQA